MASIEVTLGQASRIASAILAGVNNGPGWQADRGCNPDYLDFDLSLKVGEFFLHVDTDKLYVRFAEPEEFSCGAECCGYSAYGIAEVSFE